MYVSDFFNLGAWIIEEAKINAEIKKCAYDNVPQKNRWVI